MAHQTNSLIDHAGIIAIAVNKASPKLAKVRQCDCQVKQKSPAGPRQRSVCLIMKGVASAF